MRLTVEPFEPAHLDAIAMQPAQLPELRAMPGKLKDAANGGPAFTAFADPIGGYDYVSSSRHIVACAGLFENHAAYATAWALFAQDNGRATWAALVAAIRRVLAASGYARIDMMVRNDFAAAHGFARRIGFVQCGLFHRFGEDGTDFAVYERIN
jgi:hypothetical protein